MLFCFPASAHVIFQFMRCLLGWAGRAGSGKLGFLEHRKMEFELRDYSGCPLNNNKVSTLFRFGSLNREFYIKLKENVCFRNF